MSKIHHDIYNKVRPYTINLGKHFILLFLTIVTIWLTDELIDFLFQNTPTSVKILVFISDIVIIIHFARENIQDLIK